MSTPSQGASSASGLIPALGRLAVSESHVAPKPASASLQSISHELRGLNVSPLTDVFGLRADKLQAICLKAAVTKRGTILSLRRSIRLTSQKESAVTKEQINALLKLLDKPDVEGDAVHKLQSTHMSVVSVPLCLTPHRISGPCQCPGTNQNHAPGVV